MNFEILVQTVLVYALPVLLAITLHEAAHGYVAHRFGDNTALAAGRITMNPASHIDLLGTVIFPVLIFAGTGGAYALGYAKPVPVNFANLRRPRRDMFYVVLAGPLSNFLQAAIWGGLFWVVLWLGVTERFFLNVMKAGVLVNLAMFVFNLLPIPPLDGGRVLWGLLPYRQAQVFERIEPWGFFIVTGLLVMGLIDTYWMHPLVDASYRLLDLLISPLRDLLH